MPMENPLLTQAAQDVPPDSSTATEASTQTEAASTTPDPDAGKQLGDSGADDGKPSGRTLENVRGEFDRKLSDGLARIEGMIAGAQQTAAPAAPVATAAPDINNMSVVELEALGPNVPEAQKAAYEQLLTQRRTSETVSREVSQTFDQHMFDNKRKEATEQAFSQFPELHDTLSPMRKEANRVLNEMGESAKHNPAALLHASEAAGRRLGIKGKIPQRTQYGAPVGGGTAPAPDGSTPAGTAPISDGDADAIASSLATAMPGGKFTLEQMARIKKNSALYREHKTLFVKQ